MMTQAEDPYAEFLFPPAEPLRSGFLAADARHSVYWEEVGKADGIPVVFLHGGPGGGLSPLQRRFFDPEQYRAILFDQRGSGRSTPHADLVDNTTPHLIADMEKLRQSLGIEQWAVFGGSWGSTLALAYAIAHPERCSALFLRGIFLARPAEVRWFLYGMREIFPEHWEKFVEGIPKGERDLLAAYHRLLIDPDPAVHDPAALRWSLYEAFCSTLLPNPEVLSRNSDPHKALSVSRIEAHYFINDCFLPEGGLLAHIDRIRHIPAWIIQGRYDIICPLVSAHELAQAWPEARYTIVPDAGHQPTEPGTARALIGALRDFQLSLA